MTLETLRGEDGKPFEAEVTWCESCDAAGIKREATTHSTNPDWSGYDLCTECAAEYDRRPVVDCRGEKHDPR